MLTNKKVLIIGTVWPEPKSSAAGTRMMQLIKFFRSYNADVTFSCSASNMEFSEDLKQLGIKTEKIKINDASFNQFLKQLQPDIVLFDRFMTEEQFGWRVAEECAKALRILDTEDLHFLRDARFTAIKQGKNLSDIDVITDHARREVASIYRCDITLMISSFEYNLLINQFKIDEQILLYLPFMFNKVEESHIKKLPSYEQRAHFITIGNFLHAPNWDAVRYLKETIWPLIKNELPNAEMHVYGAYSSPKVEQLHNKNDRFLIKGRAADSESVISNARLLLAPIRFGAGLKGKLVEAMQCGTPSITTKIGAEGMDDSNEWGGAINDSPEEFAKNAVECYKNEGLWRTNQQKGIEIFNSLFDKNIHTKRFLDTILDVQKSLDNHRRNNFIGSMLQHHTMNSYKYMSKWIELKNA